MVQRKIFIYMRSGTLIKIFLKVFTKTYYDNRDHRTGVSPYETSVPPDTPVPFTERKRSRVKTHLEE